MMRTWPRPDFDTMPTKKARYSSRTVFIIILIILSGLLMLITFTNIIEKRSLIDTPFKSLTNDDDTTSQQINQSPFESLHDCWLHIFITDFVKTNLHHSIQHQYDSSNLNQNCSINGIKALLSKTNALFTTSSEFSLPSLHDLISLRRIIMLLNVDSNVQRSEEYDTAISLISNAINRKNDNSPNKIILNVHPPRSAGTTICGYFKGAQHRQSKVSNITKPQILLNLQKGKNCNAGDGDGNQFTHYPKDAKALSCAQQFDIVSNKFTVIARESPLYNNKNPKYSHSYLCPQFIYILAFRSPIERILSWLTADTRLQGIYANNTKKAVEKGDYFPNFYFSLFSYKTNDPKSNLIKMIDAEPGTPNIRIIGRNEWLRGYSSNAIMRWIGYEWRDANKVRVRGEITESMSELTEKVNANDVHFYNAIKMLLQIDYVLNFASYQNDSSMLNAMEYASKQFDSNLISTHHGIGDDASMWSVLSDHLSKHFNGAELFRWPGRRLWKHVYHKNINPDWLTDKDWKTLYDQNYFDFRLYFLAKYIEKVDLIYYNS